MSSHGRQPNIHRYSFVEGNGTSPLQPVITLQLLKMSGSSQPLPPAHPIPRVSVPVQQLQNPSPAQPVLHPQLTPEYLPPTEHNPAYTPYPDPGNKSPLETGGIMEPPVAGTAGNSNLNKSTSTERDVSES